MIQKIKINTEIKIKSVKDLSKLKIIPCILTRSNTNAKVENPMRVIDEIMNYDGVMENLEEIYVILHP